LIILEASIYDAGVCPKGLCPEGISPLIESCLEGVLFKRVLSGGVLSRIRDNRASGDVASLGREGLVRGI